MAMRSRTFAAAVVLLVLGSAMFLSSSVRADKSEVSGVFLFIDDYTNDSIVDAWASLNFTSAPIPPPNQVDNVLFEWFAPNHTMVHQESVDPNDNAWAPSSYRVAAVGRWTVNVTYTTNTSIRESLDFSVLPNVWGPGQILLSYTTVVGRSGELRILPGTEIRFPPADAFNLYGGAMRVQGKLTAVGTSGSPIAFTSNASAPAAGDWNVLSFLETADNSSVLSWARVLYSAEGVRLKGSSPSVDNVTFSNNLGENLRAEYSRSTVRDITVTGGVYGVSMAGSDIELMSVTVSGANYGLAFQGLGGRASNVLITDSTECGVLAEGASASIDHIIMTGNDVGLRADNSTLTADQVSISGGRIAVESVDGSSVLLVNSTITDVSLLHYSLSGDSLLTARNVDIGASVAIKRDVQNNSLLVIQNFLRVLARSHDTGVVLSGVTVNVTDNGRPMASVRTGVDGYTGIILLTHGVYNHTSFRRNATTVNALFSGYSFAFNNRFVDMAMSHLETFNGSTLDNDHDGNPDFNDTDDDNDGLPDQTESNLGTNPMNPDTDGDGMPDGWEFNNGFRPLDASDSGGDSDGDGLSNLAEYQTGTDPKNPDSDNDGMPDGWEVQHSLDPLDPSDANLDPDGDGYTNLQEYQNGTDPRNIESYPTNKPNLGMLGLGNYWYILLLPLSALCIEVLMVSVVYIAVVPRRKRRKSPPTEDEEED